MDKIELIKIIISGTTLLAIATSAFLVYLQIKKTFDWNKRKETQDLLFKFVTGKFIDLRDELELKFNVDILNEDQNYKVIQDGLKSDEKKRELKILVREILNYFETVCIGIKNNILDEDIVNEFVAIIMLYFWNWSKPLIKEHRKIDPTLYIEIEYYISRWKIKFENESMSLRNPGKKPL